MFIIRDVSIFLYLFIINIDKIENFFPQFSQVHNPV